MSFRYENLTDPIRRGELTMPLGEYATLSDLARDTDLFVTSLPGTSDALVGFVFRGPVPPDAFETLARCDFKITKWNDGTTVARKVYARPAVRANPSPDAMILQTRRSFEGRVVEIELIDGDSAREVFKWKRSRRALETTGYLLSVVESGVGFAKPGDARISRGYFHRAQRAAFWEQGSFDRRPSVASGRVIIGYDFAGHIDPRTNAFIPLDRRGYDALVDETDAMHFDELLEVYARGTPPDGVYDLDAAMGRR